MSRRIRAIRLLVTVTGPENTGLGGSSLGSLISLYLGMERPDVFGKLAIMSPSLRWDHHSILALVDQGQPKLDLCIWLEMGTAEGSGHLRDAARLNRLLLKRGWRSGIDLIYFEAEDAAHDEGAWSARFDQVLRFLFPSR